MSNKFYPPNLNNGQTFLSDMDAEEISYKEILQKYFLKRWYFYVLGLGLTFGAAYYYLKITPPVHNVEAKILIKEKEKFYDFNDDWIKRNLDLSAASENVSNEIEVLKSYKLMREVIGDLGLNKRSFYVKGLEQYESYSNFPVVIDSFDLYDNASEELLIKPLNQNLFELSRKGIKETYAFDSLLVTEYGSFRIKKREEEINLESRFNYLIKLYTYDEMARLMNRKVSVGFADQQKNSSILRLSIEETVVRRGIDVLNKMIEKYSELIEEKNDAIALNTLNFIDDRLKEISSDLNVVESSVEQYKLNNDISASSTSDLEILLRSITQLTDEQRNLMVNIRIVKSMKKELGSQQDRYDLIPLNLSLAKTPIVELIKPYNDLVVRREKLLQTSQESNPVVQEVNQELEQQKVSINTALENMEDDLQLALNMTNTQYDIFKKRIQSIPKKERVLVDKSRRQTITENLYIYLLEKREEMALALVSNYIPNNLVDAPRKKGSKVAPNELLIYMGSMVAGLSIPFMLILGLDFFEESVTDEKELKKLIPEVDLIGFVNQNRGKERQVALRQKRTLAAEHFRSLRTNLQFQFRNKQKSILITSTISMEGKTFIATNLAISFALAKKKTIIIDFDLHKPEMTNYLEEKGELGMSDFLCNTAELDDIIQESRVLPNLHYIASGPVLSSPSELLSEEKLSRLFSNLKQNYEVIIVDTPPIGIISDAILLNSYITNSLYVVRAGKTNKETIEKAKEILNKKMLVNPLLVLNGVKKTASYQKSYKAYIK